jgi:hypothetical protein
MNKPATVIPVIILLNACIWGFAMVMSSRALSGTDAYEQIQNILSGSAGVSLLVVGGGLAGLRKVLMSDK